MNHGFQLEKINHMERHVVVVEKYQKYLFLLEPGHCMLVLGAASPVDCPNWWIVW